MDNGMIDRLGRVWCNLNCWRWDDLCGEKPANWDLLPAFSSDKFCKHDIISPINHLIQNIIGEEGCSRAWWIHELDRTEEEWKKWWEDKEKENESNRNL